MKSLTRLSFKIFYKNKFILNPDNLKLGAPTILVSNHPSTLTDPLNAAKHVKAVVHFLANAGLFKNKIIGKFLRTFYCIPVERPRDVSGRRINNEASFDQCYEFLGRGGTLYIAAEGGSKLTRRIRKLKTGTARIALNAEAKNDFKLGIKIIPVGINYSNPKKFRSDVIINAGKTIYPKNYRAAYEKDKIAAARLLTKDLFETMKDLVIHTDKEDDDVDALLLKLQSIKRTNEKFDFKAEYNWAKIKLERLLAIKNDEEPKYKELVKITNTYCNYLKENDIGDEEFVKQRHLLFRGLFVFLGFIPALFGFINNCLLYLIPRSIINKEGFYPGYSSTIYLLFGIVAAPILYLVLFLIVNKLSGSIMISLLYLFITFILGIFSSHYFRKLKSFRAQRKVLRLIKEQSKEYHQMKELRKEIQLKTAVL